MALVGIGAIEDIMFTGAEIAVGITRRHFRRRSKTCEVVERVRACARACVRACVRAMSS